MKRISWIVAASAALALFCGPAAFAQAAATAPAPGTAMTAKPANSQQDKMKTCNADATSKGLKGDARKSFMSDCLKGSGSSAK